MADEPRPRPSRQNNTRLIVALVVTVLLVIFAIQNTREVRIDFLFFTWDSRMIYVIIVSAVAGAIAGALVQRARRRRRERGRGRDRD
jgi:uncharacterized integral membrane protein